ncbi:hypothetical protein CP02DC15_1130B, partial [Chlamydia psittaci 02DC15]
LRVLLNSYRCGITKNNHYTPQVN